MKRAVCLAMSVLLLSLTGCVPNDAGKDPPPDPVTLSLMLPQSHYKDFLKASIARFEEEHPEIRIDAQVIPDNQWIGLVKQKIAVGETPDLIRIDRSLIQDVGPQHFITFDESAPWYDRVLPDQLESKLIDGKLYGLPVGGTSSVGIVYNRALFQQYHVDVPTDMESWKAACVKLRDAGVVPLYASDKDPWTVGLGFTASAPQVLPESTWDALLNGTLHWYEVPEFYEILDTFRSFREEGLTNPDYLSAAYASAVTAMARGEAAMYITGHFFITDVLQEAPDLDLMMMPVPYRSGVLTIIPGPGQISVFQNSAHQEEAKVFLDWFSQPDNMDIFLAGWVHTAVFKDQNLQLPDWQQELYDTYISAGRTVPQMDSILSGIDLNDFWTCQQEMAAGRLTAEQVLTRWDASFAQQLSDKGLSG